jgi:ADP-heptose:LPS heptosyltransferase
MKILVVRFSSIGDIVLTTPVVRCLKQQLPGVEIHYLTKTKFASILSANPHIDKLHTIDRSINEVLSSLKNEKFDFVVDLHTNLRTKSLIWKLRVPAASFPKLNFKKWLYVRFKVNKLPEIHIVERYFETVKSLGVKNDQQPCDYFIASEDQVDLSTLGLEPNSYVAFAIGAQFATKRMPIKKLVEVCNAIEKPIVLLGGPEDAETAKSIIAQASGTIQSHCGTLRLGQSASVVQQAELLVTHDTGLMHIASAFNKRIISIWGNTTPALGMYPYMPQNSKNYSIHQVEGLSCRPCSKIGFQSCPKKHFSCMQLQDVEKIAGEVNRL